MSDSLLTYGDQVTLSVHADSFSRLFPPLIRGTHKKHNPNLQKCGAGNDMTF